MGGVFRVWGARVVRGLCAEGRTAESTEGGRTEANVRGDAGSDNTGKFRPPGPARARPPFIPHQLPRRIRTGTSGAQNSMRAPAGGWSRAVPLSLLQHTRDASPKLTTKTVELGHVLPVQRSRYVMKDPVKRARSTATSSVCHAPTYKRSSRVGLNSILAYFELGYSSH